MTKRFDIIIWGATGFTGRLVAEYLAKNAPPEINWAIAGRTRSKLEEVKKELVSYNPKCENLEILIGDAFDQPSVDRVVEQTKVIAATAGPFRKWGTPVVDACVRFGVSYCDINGESHWVKEIIEKYHEEAVKNEAMIVPSCGFDSIPSDLGTWLLVDHLNKVHSLQPKEVIYLVTKAKGTASGGTLHTGLDTLNLPKETLSQLQNDPYLLCPPDKKVGKHHKDSKWPFRVRSLNLWTSPWVMSLTNEKIVVRSSALLDYGPNFSYNEYVGVKSYISAWLLSISFLIGTFLLRFSFPKWIFSKIIKKPGEGPSRQERESGFFVLKIVGNTDQGKEVSVTVKGISDPGYGETSKMLAESAICLATLKERPFKGGILTPASAMGSTLIDRLKNAGMTFKVDL